MPTPLPKRPIDQQRLVNAHQRIETDLNKIELKKVEVVFLGDSITQFWLEVGNESWDKTFAANGNIIPSLNLGVSGDRTEHVPTASSPKTKEDLVTSTIPTSPPNSSSS